MSHVFVTAAQLLNFLLALVSLSAQSLTLYLSRHISQVHSSYDVLKVGHLATLNVHVDLVEAHSCSSTLILRKAYNLRSWLLLRKLIAVKRLL